MNFFTVTLSTFILTSFYTSKIACLMLPKIKTQFYFANNYVLITQYLKEWIAQNVIPWRNYHQTLCKTVSEYFKGIWNIKQSMMIKAST